MSTRKEIAETLRNLQHNTYYKEEIVENICDAISPADPTNTFREPEDIYQLLADLIDPTDQLVNTQIVRCKDCIFYDTVHLDCARRGWTDCDRNGFCSYGERKEIKNAIS